MNHMTVLFRKIDVLSQNLERDTLEEECPSNAELDIMFHYFVIEWR